jgi:SagB-type dehydrogenase family enzyme
MLNEASGQPGAWGNAESALVLTATFERSAYKYAERSYRYVCIDAGHAAGNAAFCAASLGWRAPLIARFDDRAVNSVLGVDPAREAALLIVPLSRAADLTPERRFELDDERQVGASFINLIHNGTCLRRVGPQGGYLPRQKIPTAPETGDMELPLPATGSHLLAALRHRRSVREYTTAPVALDELSGLCMAAEGERAGQSPTDPLIAESAQLGLYVIARDVTGLEPGVYRYLTETHSLRLLKAGDFSDACARACVQQDFCGTADALFVKTVRWSEMAVPDGDRGYCYANIRAGVLGEALCLQGTALGIGTCGVGAFLDSDLTDILGIRPDDESPLYVTAIGR